MKKLHLALLLSSCLLLTQGINAATNSENTAIQQYYLTDPNEATPTSVQPAPQFAPNLNLQPTRAYSNVPAMTSVPVPSSEPQYLPNQFGTTNPTFTPVNAPMHANPAVPAYVQPNSYPLTNPSFNLPQTPAGTIQSELPCQTKFEGYRYGGQNSMATNCTNPEEPCDHACGDCYCLHCHYRPCYYYTTECDFVPRYEYLRCCRYVPQYYNETRCKMVNEYYNVTRTRQVKEPYTVTLCRMVKQPYCVTSCSWVQKYNEETCCYEMVPQYHRQVCCKEVPQYYQEIYIREVPEHYEETCCRQVPQQYEELCARYVPQYYYVTQCKYCPQYKYKRQCKYIPQYYYKQETSCNQGGMELGQGCQNPNDPNQQPCIGY